jgi:AcrR family transcriptional regulator
MAVNKTDPRVVKTRNSLRKALVYLMRREKLEDISVQKITETANITRGTFYLHYKDKHDFIESAMHEIINEFFSQVMVDSNDFRLAKGRTVQVFSLRKAFQCIGNDADIFDVLLNNEKNNFFYEQLYNRLDNEMTRFSEQIYGNQQLEVPLNLQIAFVDSAFLGLVSRWLADGMIYTPRYMTQSVARMLEQYSSDSASLVNFFDGEPAPSLKEM